MAQLVTVRLSRSDAQPWGFRLQGGKDFGTPLVVQKVAGGSIAANAGLVAGDAVIKVNGMDVYNLRHKDAQDAVVRGGNNFEISVQRGGSTWRPTVSPAGSLPQPVLSGGSVAPVTHTSLAAKPQEVSHIGSGYNSSARPYLPSVNGDGVKSIVNKQYNTPVGMYSDETIAETLSAQAEVLAGGVLGVNFKKNERIYNSANSEVYKMLQEAENDPNDPAGESSYYWTASHAIGGQAACTSPFLSPGASHRPSHPINLQGISQQEKTSYSSASVSSYQENTKLSASTISAALTTHHGTGAGATNGAPQLGSPLSTGSNINTNISGPKPFNISSAPLSPPSAGPKSPSIYPPPTSAAAWSQPKPPSTFEAPKPSTFGSSTLPRANVGPAAPGSKGGAAGVTSAPKRGRGVLNKAVGPGGRIPQCGCCNQHIRGPFITALGRIWCPDHFICVNGECRRPLADIGFVEEKGNLYCEYCFEKYIAPSCSKCGAKIKGDCLNAIGKHFHPECFTCAYCGKLFGNSPFFLEEGNPYCEADWNEMFTTKCFACGFPVEAGDRWVEALSHNYHSQCFNCTTCKKNLEGQSFFAKGGRPYCKNHAR
ncbi:PDZ and LIM domain protein Zasp isoform X26 [Lutzomyia longipalpis]|uniref:PDZ and LIM domain protein Zasp isoform X26 n=1 Tax=Lutzomyia longipalpis TaxID=7200 RepID=UPI002483CA44|nr:PDZ and LIM domain protein Zasp isoform X26 [Lutzomyia longipalpis]XP_055690966.1 PDZ and LIM domain protein Zasp isoform X26 [Lutzomyia longipalpis]